MVKKRKKFSRNATETNKKKTVNRRKEKKLRKERIAEEDRGF